MNSGEQKSHPINPKIYVLVWAGLLILTGVTVSLAGMDFCRLSIVVVLIIAAVKSALVLNFFMHLRYEKGLLLFKLMIPGILAILVLFIGITFFDVAFR